MRKLRRKINRSAEENGDHLVSRLLLQALKNFGFMRDSNLRTPASRTSEALCRKNTRLPSMLAKRFVPAKMKRGALWFKKFRKKSQSSEKKHKVQFFGVPSAFVRIK